MAMLTWNVMEILTRGTSLGRGRPTAVGAATGAIVGLVGVTPAAGLVSPMWATFIGAFTAVSVFFSPALIKRLTGVDDTLDCFAIHGLGGMVGSALTGLFANASYSGGASGSFYGNAVSLGKQCAATSVVILYCTIATTIIFWTLWAAARVLGDTLDLPESAMGQADISLHGELAYFHSTKVARATAETQPADATEKTVAAA